MFLKNGCADRLQVEYLVVTYSKDDPKVLLSLRQAEILTALAADQELAAKGGCVPALQDVMSHNGDKSYACSCIPT